MLEHMRTACMYLSILVHEPVHTSCELYLCVEIETTKGKVSATLGGRDYDDDKENITGKVIVR